MANGIAQVHTVGKYSVSETNTVRNMDDRRFNVMKRGAKKPYVVTFQGKRAAACSCPGGIFHGSCKHMGLVRSLFG